MPVARDELLADLVIWMTLFIEDAADRFVTLDDAMKALEAVVGDLDRLTPGDKAWLVERIRIAAAAERDPDLRAVLERQPNALGLTDDSDAAAELR